MLAKTVILAPILYFLILLQSSFLPHFTLFGYGLELVFISVIFLIFFAPSLGFVSAFLGGIFLDIFSDNFIGFNVLILLGTAIFIKSIFKKYVQISFS